MLGFTPLSQIPLSSLPAAGGTNVAVNVTGVFATGAVGTVTVTVIAVFPPLSFPIIVILVVVVFANPALGTNLNFEFKGRRPGDVASIWTRNEKARVELGCYAKHDIEASLRSMMN